MANKISWFLVLTVMGVAYAKVGFVKDQSMDVVFPGPVYRQAPALPEGHMRPLGWQRRPDGPIAEESETYGTREFYDDYVSKEKPVVFRSAVVDAPVFDNWQDDKYLSRQYAKLNVSVRVKVARKKDKIESTMQVMKFKKFLYEYMYEELYMSTVVPEEMKPELPLPTFVRCGTISERLISAQLWMSSGGTSSRIHSHDDHLLHCVLFGRRDFILLEGKHRRHFDMMEEYPGSVGGHSDINTEMVNAFKYKGIARVPWIWSTLYPGDCVFVPSGYIHQVRSYGRSISLTIEFAPSPGFDDTGCTLVEDQFVPLTEAKFLLSFEDGRLKLTDTDLDIEKLKKMLLILTGNADALTKQKFMHFYRMVLGDEGVPDPGRVFEMMTSGEDETQLTADDIAAVSKKKLQKVVDVFNKAYELINKSMGKKAGKDKKKHVHEEF